MISSISFDQFVPVKENDSIAEQHIRIKAEPIKASIDPASAGDASPMRASPLHTTSRQMECRPDNETVEGDIRVKDEQIDVEVKIENNEELSGGFWTWMSRRIKDV